MTTSELCELLESVGNYEIAECHIRLLSGLVIDYSKNEPKVEELK